MLKRKPGSSEQWKARPSFSVRKSRRPNNYGSCFYTFTSIQRTNRSLFFRTQLGSAYLHLAIESQVPEFRRRVVASVEHLAAVAPETANRLVRSGLTAYVTRRRTSIPKSQNTTTENEKPAIRKQPRLLAFLSASTAFRRDEDRTLREKLLSEIIVLAHHPEICE